MLAGDGIREGALRESEMGRNAESAWIPRGIAARIAWAMVIKA
jgi:hypothetical protein